MDRLRSELKTTIDIIDKKNDRIFKVSKDYEIEYKGKSTKLKDLGIDDLQIFGIIFQENGNIDLFFKKGG